MRYLVLILTCSLLFSCSDMFEADMDNSSPEERLYTDPSFAEGLLLNAYAKLPTGYDFSEAATDDAVTNAKNDSIQRMSAGEWSSIFNPMDNWSAAYGSIAYLNKFLSIVDNVEWSWDSETRNQLFLNRYKGEALGMRGYYHFQLLMAFGGPDQSGTMMGVPYADRLVDYADKDQWDLPRLTYAETVNRIMDDLHEACTLLAFDYADTGDADYNRVNGARHKGRMSGLIARAIMAKVALHAASPAFNNGTYNDDLLTVAADTASVLLNKAGGVAALLDASAFGDPYFYDADADMTNKDVIWRQSFTSGYTWEQDNLLPSRFGNGQINPSQNFVDAFPTVDGYPVNHPSATIDAANPYANRDPRLWNMVYYNGAAYSAGDAKVVNTADDAQDGIGQLTSSTLTGYYMRKPLRVDVSLNPSALSGRQHIRPLVRYTELFLIAAEAGNELWGPDGDPNGYGYTARAIMENIRKRAGIATDLYLPMLTTSQEMTELIRNERRIELSFEGFRFWDIRRWNMELNTPVGGVTITRVGDADFAYEKVMLSTPRYESHMRFGPLPNAQLLKSDVLTQNQGW